MNINSYGFIITRHVNSEKTNKYWNRCIKCLRTFYPNRKIVVIDDNSNQDFIKADFEYKNVIYEKSEYPGAGELLPYTYFIKNHYFDNAIIIHDSVFFHKRINFESLIKVGLDVLPFWHFDADKENYLNTYKISSFLKNNYNLDRKISLNEINILGLNKDTWFGCFGVQSFINWNFINYINKKYNITNLLHVVKNRADRCCLERLFGIIFSSEKKQIYKNKSLFGKIFNYQNFGYSYDEYINDINNNKIPKYIVKVWTGR
jgi:hypothetical protein